MLKINNKETSELVAASNNSHLKCILQVALENDKNFNIKIHKVKDFEASAIEKEKLDRNKEKFEKLKKAISKYNLKIDKQQVNDLKLKFTTNIKELDINKKYTVTELKGSDLNLSQLKPEILTTKVTGANYGTFIHSVIEHLEYNNITRQTVSNVVDNVASRLDMQDRLNKKHVIEDILSMYNCLTSYLTEAQSIKNELEFVIEDKLENITGASFDEPTLIQGVVDMYVVTKEGKHIIIDFKTDRVDSSNELVDRYSVQLKIYKKAIELAYNIKVDNTFIYSFALNKLIEVDN